MPDDIQSTLDERGSRYGDFTGHAKIARALMDVMYTSKALGSDGIQRDAWLKLTPVQEQVLCVIADKIARILNGDPNYRDNWHDIQGYAKLAEDRCKP